MMSVFTLPCFAFSPVALALAHMICICSALLCSVLLGQHQITFSSELSSLPLEIYNSKPYLQQLRKDPQLLLPALLHIQTLSTVPDTVPQTTNFLPRKPTPSTEIMDSYGAGPARGCYNCGDASHQARDCPTRGPAKCYNCGGEGHMSRECPDGPKDKTCYKCGQPGHISRDCQNPAAEGAGRGGGGFQSGGGSQECYKV
ncbi:hypothetical protein ONS96_003169 [Cadophora gregata f. sp. sojae]|nr:hypothetical protein ONS96_003169 [Cadophora gregata f. sp. sojae]